MLRGGNIGGPAGLYTSTGTRPVQPLREIDVFDT